MCFSRKKKEDPGPKYDFSVPDPKIEKDPSQFIIVGPTGAGKRALASAFAHLTIPFSMDLFDDETKASIRLRAQYTAVIRMVDALQAAMEKRKKKKKLDEEAITLLGELQGEMKELGIKGLTKKDDERQKFLKAAKKLVGNESARKCISAFYAKENDLALLHFSDLNPEMFDEEYSPVYEDVLYSGTMNGPDMFKIQDMLLTHKDYPVHILVVPGEQWESSKLPDVPVEGPYSLVIVVPIDDYIHDRGGNHTDDKEKKEEKKEDKKKKDRKKKKKGELEESEEVTSPTLSTMPRADSSLLGVSPSSSSGPVKKGFRNKLTDSLDVIEKMRDMDVPLLKKAENVVLLFSRFDIFDKLTPADGSIKDSFPDFYLEENAKNIINYVTDAFEDALHAVCTCKVRSTSCCFLDSADMERTVLPHLFDIADATIRIHERKVDDAKTAEMVNRAKELCGGKPIPVPFNSETRVLTIESGEVSDIGKRKTNEDALVVIDDYKSDTAPQYQGRLSYYAVYDGHGGAMVSDNCSKIVHKMVLEHPAFPYDPILAFRDSFRRADPLVTSPAEKSGSTALCCAIYGTTLYLANIGDSECVLGTREADKGRYRSTLLSVKHNPVTAEEKKRIGDIGGSVVFGRLFGALAVSRGFGDATFKQPGREYVSLEPHVLVRSLDRTCHFVILACDGLWDTVSYDLAVKVVGEAMDRGDGPEDAAKNLRDLTLSRGSQDNVSVIVVYFRWSRR